MSIKDKIIGKIISYNPEEGYGHITTTSVSIVHSEDFKRVFIFESHHEAVKYIEEQHRSFNVHKDFYNIQHEIKHRWSKSSLRKSSVLDLINLLSKLEKLTQKPNKTE